MKMREAAGHSLAAAWLALALAAAALPAQAEPAGDSADSVGTDATPVLSVRRFLPVIAAGAPPSNPCSAVPGAAYQAIYVPPPASDRPAASHGDLNLALRGYVPTSAYLGLVDYNGDNDSAAPQLPYLFADGRTPVVQGVQRVYDWSWGCNCRGGPIASPEVTLANLRTTPGEVISAPSSSYQIGDGYQMLVLYAAADRLTLKLTREDNVVRGYTVHLENLCLEPGLLALYQSWNAAGRSSLPALRGGQAVGRAAGAAIGVAVRDNGTFLDPRSRKDWWQGR